MKIALPLLLLLSFTSCSVFLNKNQSKALSTRQLFKEPWYYCDKDSLWTVDKNCKPVRCIDYTKVRKLRVGYILEEVYLEVDNLPSCLALDSSTVRALKLTCSNLKKISVPIANLPNLQVIDLSNHYFYDFPYEIFSVPLLTAVNLESLCEHDNCENCLYVSYRYENPASPNLSKPIKIYKTDLKPYYPKIRTLKYISGLSHFHPDDIALADSINNKHPQAAFLSVYKDRNPCFFDMKHESDSAAHQIIYRQRPISGR